jgi:hypothetical protein
MWRAKSYRLALNQSMKFGGWQEHRGRSSGQEHVLQTEQRTEPAIPCSLTYAEYMKLQIIGSVVLDSHPSWKFVPDDATKYGA